VGVRVRGSRIIHRSDAKKQRPQRRIAQELGAARKASSGNKSLSLSVVNGVPTMFCAGAWQARWQGHSIDAHNTP
jgi:hypothetical protein